MKAFCGCSDAGLSSSAWIPASARFRGQVEDLASADSTLRCGSRFLVAPLLPGSQPGGGPAGNRIIEEAITVLLPPQTPAIRSPAGAGGTRPGRRCHGRGPAEGRPRKHRRLVAAA